MAFEVIDQLRPGAAATLPTTHDAVVLKALLAHGANLAQQADPRSPAAGSLNAYAACRKHCDNLAAAVEVEVYDLPGDLRPS